MAKISRGKLKHLWDLYDVWSTIAWRRTTFMFFEPSDEHRRLVENYLLENYVPCGGIMSGNGRHYPPEVIAELRDMNGNLVARDFETNVFDDQLVDRTQRPPTERKFVDFKTYVAGRA